MNDRLREVAARFGPRLRELRTGAGLTQAALAARCDTKQSVIAEYEGGASEPRWGSVIRLADALGVTPDAFTAAPPPQMGAGELDRTGGAAGREGSDGERPT